MQHAFSNRLLTTTLLCACWLFAPAQEIVQVVTKTVEETYTYRPGYEVAVEGEKAEIFVETWAKNEVSVRLELTAKHRSLETAKAELENLAFVAERVKNKIYLRNYRKDKSKTAQSQLIIHYYITLPEECPVYVKNHFGIANISNLRNRLRVIGEYSQININNVEGLLDIRTRFGDILGEHIDGNVTINARRSDITLEDIGGSYTINAQYGVLRLAPNMDLTGLQVNADKSEVHLIQSKGLNFGYLLTTSHGDLQVPPDIRTIDLESTPEVRRIQIRPTEERYGNITVTVTFGDLYLEQAQERKRRLLVD